MKNGGSRRENGHFLNIVGIVILGMNMVVGDG